MKQVKLLSFFLGGGGGGTRKTVFAKREKLYFAKLYFETEEKPVVVCKVSETVFYDRGKTVIGKLLKPKFVKQA